MRRRGMRSGFAAAGIIAVVAAGSACGGGGSSGEGGNSPEAAPHAHHSGAQGLFTADKGVHLEVRTPALRVGKQQFVFRIVTHGGQPVTEYEVEQERELHLIVVRRDLVAFQHLHPTLAPDGTWSVNATFPHRGVYRVFADFVPAGGERTVLGVDLPVGGGIFVPKALPKPNAAVRVGEYDVRVDAAEISDDGRGELVVEISRGGEPVTDLQPYLGALGHAVVLRDYDLAYLHAHPLTSVESGSDGTLKFDVELPAQTRYRAFVEFRHEDRVHVAAFTLAWLAS